MKLHYLVIVTILLLSSCTKITRLLEREKELGTNGNDKWAFHRLSDVDKGVTLAFPGYIIGIEKAVRKKIGAPKFKKRNPNSISSYFDYNKLNYEDTIPRVKKKVLNDRKAMFISSVHNFHFENKSLKRIKNSTIYDAYDKSKLVNAKEAYIKGFEVLDSLGLKINEEISKNKITHVFVYCMGWNTDQQESLRNFNSLFSKVLDRADTQQIEFRPLFLGITWPSYWNEKKINVLSYFNKANDSDEIGLTWLNYLLNKKILSNSSSNNFKTIVFGHSFGARVTSRAVMTQNMLNTKYKPVDLLINIQAAYSINRFSENKGLRKHEDYLNWSNCAKNIALIGSQYDKAVRLAFYAPLAGGNKAYKKVLRTPTDYQEITSMVLGDGERITISNKNEFLLINASTIVNTEAYNKGGFAHNDIYNDEVADLIWNLIYSKTISTK